MHKELQSDLFLKTEQLLFFRLAFAGVSLCLSLGLAWFARAEFRLLPFLTIIGMVIAYSAFGLILIKRQSFCSRDDKLPVFNAVLFAFDVVSLTGLVHFSRGVESDLYVLYLLPILLSSYTFTRKGILATALFVSILYVSLLLLENRAFVPYLLGSYGESGLAAAYAHRLWQRVLVRSALLVSVSFVWARFCEYMSSVAQQSANRLREQLSANTRLVSEMETQAQREKLVNSINSAVRSTLDLNQIFETAVNELGRALQVHSCAIVCQNSDTGEPIIICESIHSNASEPAHADTKLLFNHSICSFLLEKKSRYEKNALDGSLVKAFVFENPAKDPLFSSIKRELLNAGITSLVINPMMYADQSKGILLIAELHKKRNWNLSELDLIKSVAAHVSVAIEHAELVEQLSRKNKDLMQKNLNLDATNLELRAIQSQLVHQEKMASLGRLVAGIAHELNNPINFVHGNLPYLEEYFEDLKSLVKSLDSIPKDYRTEVEKLKIEIKYDFLVTDLDHILADLNEGTERIRHIIRNLRSFSRLDEAELKEASIQEGLESTLKILSQYYGRDKIPVRLDFAQIQPILCYPGQLNQVWMNLLSNAAEATIAVSEPQVWIKTEARSNKVLISVSDNGPGIDPEVESKIFEPFFTTKAAGQGTGLGLSICHSIIERHGGQIWCEPRNGGGTTFIVQIPIYAKPSDLARIIQDRTLR